MPLFNSKPKTVRAEQFVNKDRPPLGVHRDWHDGTGEPSFYVITIQGTRVDVNLGEWIITGPNGVNHYPCADDVFRANYEEVK